jgi:uncharacterized protein (TIGR03000 family)
MRRVLAILVGCFVLTGPSFGQEAVFPDNTTSNQPGGLMIIRKGNQTTWSLGGAFLPRSVKVVTNTPEGKVVARFRMPSVFRDPNTPPLPTSAPGIVLVEIPDSYGQIFIEGELIRTNGTLRQFESPTLALGKAYPIRLRAVYMVGDKFLIEDQQITIRAGETSAVTFDGSRALAVRQFPAAKK